MTLVVILTVRREALEAFRRFEEQAARTMADHGGRIERTIVVDAPETPALLKEIHVVTFPDAMALRAYRADDRLGAVAHLREAAVVHTEVLVGEDGPSYAVER